MGRAELTFTLPALLQLSSAETPESRRKEGEKTGGSPTAPLSRTPACPPWCWWGHRGGSANLTGRGAGPSRAA